MIYPTWTNNIMHVAGSSLLKHIGTTKRCNFHLSIVKWYYFSAPPLEIKSYANQRPMRAVADEILDKSNTSPSLFILRPGLSGIKDSFSFEDAFKPGKFVRHSCAVCCLRTFLADDENDATFKYDASFARISYTAYRGCVRYQSVNYPDHSLAYLANGRLAIEPYDPIRVEDYLWIESSKDEG